MPKLMESKVEQLNKMIIDKAFEVFSEKGYIATLDEIRYSLDIGKGTLYNHFGNKEALFYSVVNQKLIELETALSNDLDTKSDVKIRLLKITEIALKFFLENLNIWRILFYQLSNRYNTHDRYKTNQKKREELLARFDCITRALEKLIEEGKTLDLFKNISPQKAGSAYFSIIMTTAHLEQGKSISPQKSAEEIVDLFMNGLAI
jgi:TetR/AcrR family transcriptional regulator